MSYLDLRVIYWRHGENVGGAGGQVISVAAARKAINVHYVIIFLLTSHIVIIFMKLQLFFLLGRK